jgi:hypothetical protein
MKAGIELTPHSVVPSAASDVVYRAYAREGADSVRP